MYILQSLVGALLNALQIVTSSIWSELHKYCSNVWFIMQ